jgi:hypothetical protein
VGTTESEFLELVNQLGEAQEGAFRGRFDYPEAAAKDLWFPLPVKMAGRSDNDTYEIRGVRGAKVSESEEEPEYLFNLDRPTSEEVTLSIDSEVNGPIDLANSRALFAQSVAISRELVGSG